MKLRLTCWAEDLKKPRACRAIVTLLHKETGVKPTVVGQTEVIENSSEPDWTESFLIDYELGQEEHLVFSLYDGKSSIGSTLFEVGSILGSSGVQAKELKDGGVVAVRLEEVRNSDQVKFQIRGHGLQNLDGIGFSLNKSDPFFELQRGRKHPTRGTIDWDAVYRSQPIQNDLNPIFPEVCVDLENLGRKFKLVVLDHDRNGSHDSLGSVELTVDDLIQNVNETALQDVASIDTGKSFTLKKGTQEVGKVLVVKACLIPGEKMESSDSSNVAASTDDCVLEEVSQKVATIAVAEEPEINLAVEEDIKLEPLVDENAISPTFCNYVAGGCELRVVCGIDATGSNGNPREESSLHFFKDDGLNSYEDALSSICSILAKFDSDQKYPVFGFGAKKNGVVHHCFPLGDAEADGIDGILSLYRDTFRSGIVMSQPRDFSEVIRAAGMEAKKDTETAQSYSILLLFSNGSPADCGATLQALKDVDDSPLSVVFVGVGENGDFDGTKSLEKSSKGTDQRDKVRFVHYHADQDADKLTQAALHDIPVQLENYFVKIGIYPLPESDEIEVLPYNPSTDVSVPIDINDSGEVTVTEDVKPPQQQKLTFAEVRKLGLDMHKKMKKNKAFGKMQRKLKGKAMRQARGKINKLFGSKIL